MSEEQTSPIGPGDVLRSALEMNLGFVYEVTSPAVARQAIELCRMIGVDPADMLDEFDWWEYPDAILSIAVDGDDLDREAARHAVICALRTRHLWEPENRRICYEALLMRWRGAPLREIREVYNRLPMGPLYGPVNGALNVCPEHYAASDARNLIDGYDGPTTERDWQQARLIERTLTLLDRS